MSPTLEDQIDSYYKARKPYTKLMNEMLTSEALDEQLQLDLVPTKETGSMQRDRRADVQIANAEIKALLGKLEAARIKDSPIAQNGESAAKK